MPNYTSPALYIDFARLPPPDVIETISFETLLSQYQADVVSKNDKLAAAVKLEQSPTNVILEAEAYGEMLVRARVNAAARAVMLAFSKGADLDNLAAFFGCERLAGETDDSLRRRAQLAPEAFTTAGSEGAYIYQTLTSDVRIRDATAVKMNNFGGVRVSVMQSGSDPVPTTDIIYNVVNRLNSKGIKPLTDVISVVPVKVIKQQIVANISLYPGPDAALVMADIGTALNKVRANVSLIGRDLTRSAIISALNQEGVQSVDLISPAQNVVVDTSQCALIESATVTPLPFRVE
ncbi:baseplate assembly protein [Bradyrhizobium erythrophlei]|uniref:Phage-related baseplate assembly protein n=1 Tax=Bradyrhizobium erythrophlei TaxID=1437360 RepID=A0A1M5PXF3_9BRAD|nr:baseplate J/gp47 family protein [Bradyrhizobium erythrophlei]SHH06376.1 Phage-related baseplate assembly protein [Bradyrhizobium erythrophlei]